MALRQIVTDGLNILYPPQCLLCQTGIETSNNICPDCFKKLHFITKPLCNICGLPKKRADNICEPCLENPSIAQTIRAPFYYDDTIKKLILSFKYGDNLQLAQYFTPLMVQAGAEIIEQTDFFVPVPLHWFKRVWRQYNQAEVLAGAIANKTKIPSLNNIVSRQKWAGQKGKNAKQRTNSLKNAFKIAHGKMGLIQGKNITIIDDVITTKATINEIARILYNHGAKNVFAIAIARVGVD